MANAEAKDVLKALREAYSSRADVVLDGDAVVVGQQRFPAATATRYRIAQKRLTAGSIVFFMREYLKDPKMTLRTYYRACKEAKVQPVQTNAWSDLHAYLTGASSSSANVEEAKGVAQQGKGGAAKAATPARDNASMAKQALCHIALREEEIATRKTITQAPNADFSSVLKMYADATKSLSRKAAASGKAAGARRGKSLSAAARSFETGASFIGGPGGDDDTAGGGSAAASTSQAADGGKRKKQGRKVGSPIIIVPRAASAFLSMYNARELLEEGTYKSSEERRQAFVERREGRPAKLIVHRKLSTGERVRFRVIDNGDMLSHTDWNLVVGVFALGKQWQFRNWRWNKPSTLFDHVPGFFLMDAALKPPEEVRSWNVTMLPLTVSKAHEAGRVMEEFWTAVEQFMKVKRPFLIQDEGEEPDAKRSRS